MGEGGGGGIGGRVTRYDYDFFYNLYGNFITVFLIENWLIKNLFRVTYNFLPSSQIFMDSFFFNLLTNVQNLILVMLRKGPYPFSPPKRKCVLMTFAEAQSLPGQTSYATSLPPRSVHSNRPRAKHVVYREGTAHRPTCSPWLAEKVLGFRWPEAIRRPCDDIGRTCKKESDNNTGNTAHSRGLCQWMGGRQTLSG